jgi:capsular polysaccharide biosynthesis protein
LVDLSQQLAVLRPRLFLIILVTVIAGILSFALASLIPKTYEAQATLLVGQGYSTSQQSQPPQINYDSFLASEQLATTLAQLVDTRPFLAKVTARLGWNDDLTAMRNRVDAQAPPASLFITISARAGDDVSAANLAGAVADELVAEAPTILVNSGSTKPEGVVSIVDPAVAAEAVKSPKVTLYAALGAMTALIVAITTIFILAYRETPQSRRGPAARRVGAPEPLPTSDPPLATSQPGALTPPAVQADPATGRIPRSAPWPGSPSGPVLLTEVRPRAPVMRAESSPLAETGAAISRPAAAAVQAEDRTELRPRPTPVPVPAVPSSLTPTPKVTASTASAPVPKVSAVAPPSVPPPARRAAGAPPAKPVAGPIKANAPATPAPRNEAKPKGRARRRLAQPPSSD